MVQWTRPGRVGINKVSYCGRPGVYKSLQAEQVMADNKKRNVKEENDEGRQEPKLINWHLPEIIYISDSEEEVEPESERSPEVIIISSDKENLEAKSDDPVESWEDSQNSSSESDSESEGSSWESGLSNVSMGSDDVFYAESGGGVEQEKRGVKRKRSAE